jgi:hypothetical protein
VLYRSHQHFVENLLAIKLGGYSPSLRTTSGNFVRDHLPEFFAASGRPDFWYLIRLRQWQPVRAGCHHIESNPDFPKVYLSQTNRDCSFAATV